MPSAKFESDFTSFDANVRQSNLKLVSFQTDTEKVAAALSKMTDSFTGRQVISEATMMAEAVSRIGSPARLTAKELQTVGAVAAEAREKLIRVGEDVPPKIDRLANAAARARGEVSGLGGSIRQFDGVLAAMGVHIGPELRGIEDIANAAGDGQSKLGGLATAGLVAGAAIGGWKLGRAAADALDLDEKIGNLTARLLGLGDVAGQEAAAGQDALARASKWAGMEITSVSLAQRINLEAAQQATKANAGYSDQLARMEGPAKSQKDLAAWNAELAVLKSSGLLPSLTADINTHNFSQAVLADRYKLSAGAMSIWVREAGEVERITKNNSAQEEKLAKQVRDRDEARRVQAIADAAAKKKRVDDELLLDVSVAEGHHQVGIAAAESQRDALIATQKTNDALREQARAAALVTRTYTLEVTKANLAETLRGAGLGTQVQAGTQLAAQGFSYTEILNILRGGAKGAPTGSAISGFDPRAAAGPGGGWGGAAPAVHTNVYVNGVIDATNGQLLGDVVGQSVAKSVATGRRGWG